MILKLYSDKNHQNGLSVIFNCPQNNYILRNIKFKENEFLIKHNILNETRFIFFQIRELITYSYIQY
jgi:hypothetical protein